MSLASPIEMSLEQSVVGTFGVTYDDGDPDERSGTDPTSRDDRPRGWSAHGGDRGDIDEHGSSSGVPASSRVRGRWPIGSSLPQTRPPEQSHAWRDISTNGPGAGSGALPG